MCGIAGVFNINRDFRTDVEVLNNMTDMLIHRGPDEQSSGTVENFGYGFRRLSIIDLAGGSQPFYNHDRSVVMLCNGEIYNYKALRKEMEAKGAVFSSDCDVEVIVHLYAHYGISFVERLNGQFGFCIFDQNENRLYLARDHFGICPLFYTMVDGTLVYASEIKSILKYPGVQKEVDLTGLDQTLSFPGMVSPQTMFKGVHSIKPGHFVQFDASGLKEVEYWDMDYPLESDPKPTLTEDEYVEQLEELLMRSVELRLNADVPVGFYLSGGLDSSLIGSLSKSINKGNSYPSFSIRFPSHNNKEIDEQPFQQIMNDYLNCEYNAIPFDWNNIHKGLKKAIWHSECPLKETYNTCSLALSQSVRDQNIKVILSGEGADEMFGGYVGYRFDTQRKNGHAHDLNAIYEEQVRTKLWADPHFFYEKNQHEFTETKQALYADGVNARFNDFNSLNRLAINKERLKGRHVFHKRSYVDFKLRLSDHLISDHCDRVAYANSVEGRYPFLDIDLFDFVRKIPPSVMLTDLIEKYLLKKMARKHLPSSIIDRQKFGFVAPGSPHLLNNNIDWIEDMLSDDRIKRQGYFNPVTIRNLKKIYSKPGFKLKIPYESDLLIVILTFNIFLEEFELPDFS